MQNENISNSIVTVKEWVITYLLMMIPIVNIILMFVWAFGSNTKVSKSNWAKTALLFMAIGVVIYLILIIAGVSILNY